MAIFTVLLQSPRKSDHFQGFKGYFDALNPNFMVAKFQSFNLASFGQFLAKKWSYMKFDSSGRENFFSSEFSRDNSTHWFWIVCLSSQLFRPEMVEFTVSMQKWSKYAQIQRLLTKYGFYHYFLLSEANLASYGFPRCQLLGDKIITTVITMNLL